MDSPLHPYPAMKRRLLGKMTGALSRKASSNRLVGVYYCQKPDPVDDGLSVHLFRKHADRHYPLVYFHPASRAVDGEFLRRYDAIPVALEDSWFCSKISYSLFMTSPGFYDSLRQRWPEADWYLVFQWDSFLIQGGLEKYMGFPYDYYGSVWEKGVFPGAWCEPRNPAREVRDASLHGRLRPMRVGNGGISLRRIAPCREVCEKYRLDQLSYMQEDAFYCNFGQLTGLRFATEDVARRFAWEDAPAIKYYIERLGISKPLGFHNLPVEMAEVLLTEALGGPDKGRQS